MQLRIAAIILLMTFAAAAPSRAQGQEKARDKSPTKEERRAGKKHQARELTPEEIEKARQKAKHHPSQGATFYIEAIAPNQFSLLFTDAAGQSVAGSFTLRQIQLFEAVMAEARRFADTEESTGTSEAPVTTRFQDKTEKAFVVDVQKGGRQSRFYVSADCAAGKITIDAGTIKRGDKNPGEVLFLTMQSRVHAEIEATKPQRAP